MVYLFKAISFFISPWIEKKKLILFYIAVLSQDSSIIMMLQWQSFSFPLGCVFLHHFNFIVCKCDKNAVWHLMSPLGVFTDDKNWKGTKHDVHINWRVDWLHKESFNQARLKPAISLRQIDAALNAADKTLCLNWGHLRSCVTAVCSKARAKGVSYITSLSFLCPADKNERKRKKAIIFFLAQSLTKIQTELL